MNINDIKMPIISNYSLLWTVSCPEVFLGKGVLRICSKFTGEQPCRGSFIKRQTSGTSSDNK